MNRKIGILFFSPTNTTKSICQSIADGLATEGDHMISFNCGDDVTRKRIQSPGRQLFDNFDWVVVGSPVYSGKLPLQFIDFLHDLEGTGVNTIAVVVYGNRDFGNALHSLVGILTSKEFKVRGGAAFIGQHSYSSIYPVALGRPDSKDLEKAQQLGHTLTNPIGFLKPDNVPIQHDRISDSNRYDQIKSRHIKRNCISCGKCHKVCPDQLVDKTGSFQNKDSKQRCKGCMACVNACKHNARKPALNIISSFVAKSILSKAAKTPKEPLILIPQ